MAQAGRLESELKGANPDLEVEIVIVRTSGDRGNREQLGAFVREIQEALLEHRVDVALHCLKDIPTQQVSGLILASYLPREDARDTIITRGRNWIDLGRDSVVGTGSVRRTSQLASHRPDFRFKPLVGNVDTRLRKLQEGEYDAIVLAIAGLKRLGVLDIWEQTEFRDLKVEPLSTDLMLPAPGQAILVLETREGDQASQALVAALHDARSAIAADAERSFLKAFGGGCSVPVAAFAQVSDESVELRGLVASPDGSRVLRGHRSSPICDAARLGSGLADQLIAQGAMDLFEARIAT
jgi:hydroxymethylbilane synthase